MQWCSRLAALMQKVSQSCTTTSYTAFKKERNMSKRKAFNFYNSYWEQIKLLNNKQQLLLFKAICQVQFLEVNISDIEFKDNILNIVWTGIKHSIETSLKGYISKQKSLEIQIVEPLAKGLKEGGSSPPSQQEKVKEEEKGKEEEQLIELKYSELEKETWDKWLRYKKSQFNFKYMTIETEQIALSKLISLSGNNDKKANAIIYQSVENGWKGLFDIKKNGSADKSEKEFYIPPKNLIK